MKPFQPTTMNEAQIIKAIDAYIVGRMTMVRNVVNTDKRDGAIAALTDVRAALKAETWKK